MLRSGAGFGKERTLEKTRLRRVDGLLERSNDDDSLLGRPCGKSGECSLTAMGDAFIDDVGHGIFRPWKQFKFVQPAFTILLEAGDVSIVCGLRASSQKRAWQ